MDLEEVKLVIRSILIAQKTPCNIRHFNSSFLDSEGRHIPYQEYGYSSLCEFLADIPDYCEIVYNRGEPYVKAVCGAKSQHVKKLVAGQKNNKPVSRPGRTSLRRGTPAFRPKPSNYFVGCAQSPKSRINHEVLSQVVRLIESSPKGISKDRILTEIRKRTPHCAIHMHEVEEQFKSLSHKIWSDHQNFYPKNYVKGASPKYQRKRYSPGPLSPRRQMANGRAEMTGIKPGGESEDSDDYFDQPNTERQYSNAPPNHHDQYRPAEDRGNPNVPKKSKRVDEEVNYNHQYDDIGSADVYYDEAVGIDETEYEPDQPSDLVSERTQYRLTQLMKQHPKGIRCSELPSLYEEAYAMRLDYVDLGFNSVCDFVSSLPGIFKIGNTNSRGDWILLDPNQPDNLGRREPESQRNLASLYNIYGEIDTDSETRPLPAKQSSQMAIKTLIPNNVMNLGETTGHVCAVAYVPRDDTDAKILEVYVVEVFTPSFFWIQLRHNKDKFESMMGELHDFYSTHSAKFKIPQPVLVEGLNCACLYKAHWHRAMIQAVKPDLDVTVLFYDYGTVKTYSYKDVYFLHKRFGVLPAQAIPCALYNNRPIGTGGSKPGQRQGDPASWSPEAIRLFINKFMNEPLLATVTQVDEENNSMSVVLTDTRDEVDDLHINDMMVQQGFAVYGPMVCKHKNFAFQYFLKVQRERLEAKQQMIENKRASTKVSKSKKFLEQCRNRKTSQSSVKTQDSTGETGNAGLTSIEIAAQFRRAKIVELPDAECNVLKRGAQPVAGIEQFTENKENIASDKEVACKTISVNWDIIRNIAKEIATASPLKRLSPDTINQEIAKFQQEALSSREISQELGNFVAAEGRGETTMGNSNAAGGGGPLADDDERADTKGNATVNGGAEFNGSIKSVEPEEPGDLFNNMFNHTQDLENVSDDEMLNCNRHIGEFDWMALRSKVKQESSIVGDNKSEERATKLSHVSRASAPSSRARGSQQSEKISFVMSSYSRFREVVNKNNCFKSKYNKRDCDFSELRMRPVMSRPEPSVKVAMASENTMFMMQARARKHYSPNRRSSFSSGSPGTPNSSEKSPGQSSSSVSSLSSVEEEVVDNNRSRISRYIQDSQRTLESAPKPRMPLFASGSLNDTDSTTKQECYEQSPQCEAREERRKVDGAKYGELMKPTSVLTKYRKSLGAERSSSESTVDEKKEGVQEGVHKKQVAQTSDSGKLFKIEGQEYRQREVVASEKREKLLIAEGSLADDKNLRKHKLDSQRAKAVEVLTRSATNVDVIEQKESQRKKEENNESVVSSSNGGQNLKKQRLEEESQQPAVAKSPKDFLNLFKSRKEKTAKATSPGAQDNWQLPKENSEESKEAVTTENNRTESQQKVGKDCCIDSQKLQNTHEKKTSRVVKDVKQPLKELHFEGNKSQECKGSLTIGIPKLKVSRTLLDLENLMGKGANEIDDCGDETKENSPEVEVSKPTEKRKLIEVIEETNSDSSTSKPAQKKKLIEVMEDTTLCEVTVESVKTAAILKEILQKKEAFGDNTMLDSDDDCSVTDDSEEPAENFFVGNNFTATDELEQNFGGSVEDLILKVSSDDECKSEDSGALKVDCKINEHILNNNINELIEKMSKKNVTLEFTNKKASLLVDSGEQDNSLNDTTTDSETGRELLAFNDVSYTSTDSEMGRELPLVQYGQIHIETNNCEMGKQLSINGNDEFSAEEELPPLNESYDPGEELPLATLGSVSYPPPCDEERDYEEEDGVFCFEDGVEFVGDWSEQPVFDCIYRMARTEVNIARIQKASQRDDGIEKSKHSSDEELKIEEIFEEEDSCKVMEMEVEAAGSFVREGTGSSTSFFSEPQSRLNVSTSPLNSPMMLRSECRFIDDSTLTTPMSSDDSLSNDGCPVDKSKKALTKND